MFLEIPFPRGTLQKVIFLSVSDSCISCDVILELQFLCLSIEGKRENPVVLGLAVMRVIVVSVIDCGFCKSPMFKIPNHGEGRTELSLIFSPHLQIANMFHIHFNELGMEICILSLNRSHWRFSEKMSVWKLTNLGHFEFFWRDFQMLGRCYCLLT